MTLGRALGAAVSSWSSDRAAVIALPAPAKTPAFDAANVVLRTADEQFVGWGTAAEYVAAGADRMAELATVCRLDAERVALEGAIGFEPRFFGGVAFEPEATAGRWRDFGAARFAIPRWTWRSGPTPVLQLVLTGSADEIRAQADDVVRAYQELVSTRPTPRPPRGVRVAAPDSYERDVAGALRAIEAGLADKIVLSRDVIVEGDMSGAAVLERLDANDALATFMFERGGATFVGATPERLLRVDGVVAHSEAVAGSAPATEPHALDTDKNRREHHAVVAWIRDKLAPLSTAVDAAVSPTVRRLPHVHHFVTPIVATLPKPRHVLEVAASLFPTPAVAGTPLVVARRAIREAERRPRGWYAGAIGSFDTEGRGELFVALRCALIEERRATVFAGAGIVAGSSPEAERRETEVKAQTMLAALGVEP